MRTLALSAFSLLVPAVAMASFGGKSDVEDVEFNASARVFNGVDWQFDAISTTLFGQSFTAGVNADITADLVVDQLADSEVTWPSALTHRWKGITQGGTAGIEGTAALNINVTIGSTSVNFPVLTREFVSAKKFTSLLLPGAGSNLVFLELEPDDVFEFRFPVESYLESVGLTASTFGQDNWAVYVVAALVPQGDVAISGSKVTSNLVDITTANGAELLGLPNTHNGKFPVESVWHGTAASTFEISVQLGFEVITWPHGGTEAGGTKLAIDFDVYSLEFANDDIKFASAKTNFEHPLPAIGVRTQVDMGSQVVVGTEVEAEIPIQNIGAVGLEGEYTLVGDAAFRIVGNNTFFVGANSQGTATVAFAPTDVGNFAGTLTFESNDPKMPTINVPVFGTGIDPADDPNNPGDGDGGLETRGCGCDSTPAGAPASLMGLALLGLALRRRRQG